MSSPATYEFDRFRIDVQTRRLYAADSTTPVELPPRALDALLYFVERPGELLGKAELMKALWPHVIVEENSLNQVISVLRRVLGEKPSEHRYIVTAPGRGYRFVAAVRQAAGPADDLSIAILPFGGDLGDAIAVDLIRALSARSRIRVAAHSSSFAFRDTPADTRTIARTLNVARLLEGNVVQRGDGIAVSCRLLDGRTGLQLWATELARDARDVAALQAELARDLHRCLDPDAVLAAPPARVPPDPEAYRLYLRALSHTMKPGRESVSASIALLQQAVARDPLFARAKSLLAIQYTTCVMFGFPLPNALELARHEVAGALDIDDQNGETHCAAAVIDCLGGAWVRAEESFRIAHRLSADPLISGLRCAYLLLSVGHLQRALQQAEYAVRVAPTHPIGMQMLAVLHLALGDDEAARRYVELALDLGVPRDVAPMSDILAQLAQRAGDAAATDALLASSTTGPEPAAPDPPTRKRLVLQRVLRGDLDGAYACAFDSLDHYARDSTVGGAWGVLWMPEMAPFRADERFALFARRLRLFEYWSEYGPPDGYALSGERLVAVSRGAD